jgi:hypothetical protein
VVCEGRCALMRAKDSCDQHGAVGVAAIIGGVGDARQAFEALHGGL